MEMPLVPGCCLSRILRCIPLSLGSVGYPRVVIVDRLVRVDRSDPRCYQSTCLVRLGCCSLVESRWVQPNVPIAIVPNLWVWVGYPGL